MPHQTNQQRVQLPDQDRAAIVAARKARQDERRQFRVAAITDVLNTVVSHYGPISDQYRNSLRAKLITHLTRTALTTPDRIREFPAATLADELRENPSLIGSNAGIAAILDAHARAAQTASTLLAKTIDLNGPPPCRIPLWEGGDYRLDEATDPRHLQQDSIALKHCVGATHDSATLKLKGLKETDPEAIHYLHYWMKMKKGETRILTLMKQDTPVATIEYNVTTKAIVQIEGNPRHITGKEPFFKPLCGALFAIRDDFDLTSIQGLPKLPDGVILTREGTPVLATPANLADALTGTVVLTSANVSMLPVATQTRLITVDVTALPQRLTDTLEAVAGMIRTFTSQTASFPSLRSANVDASSAQTVSLPLHQSGDVDASSAQTVSLPLHQSGYVNASSAQTVSLPLHQSGNVYARSAQTVVVPAISQKLVRSNPKTQFIKPTPGCDPSR